MEQIYADLIPGGKMPLLHASQYDEGREYRINLTENKQAYTLDGTELLSISVRKGDNTIFTADVGNTFGGKSYIDFVSTEQMCAVAGYNYGELTIEKNNTRIGTVNFMLVCEPSPEASGLTSESEINNLNRQIDDYLDETLPEVLGDDVPPIVERVIDETLAPVAKSGSYNDLENKPTIPAPQVNSDWNANSGVSQILNKPNLATVATTGDYNDLLNKPSVAVIDDSQASANKVYSSEKVDEKLGVQDAELVDIRIGADGKTYALAGDAVRGQFNDVVDIMNSLPDTIYYGIKIDSFEQGSISANGEEISRANRIRSAEYIDVSIYSNKIIPQIDSELYKFGIAFYSAPNVSGFIEVSEEPNNVNLKNGVPVDLPSNAKFIRLVISLKTEGYIYPSDMNGKDIRIKSLISTDYIKNKLDEFIYPYSSLIFKKGAFYANGTFVNTANGSSTNIINWLNSVYIKEGCYGQILVYNKGVYVGKVDANGNVNTTSGSWKNFRGLVDVLKILNENNCDGVAIALIPDTETISDDSGASSFGHAHLEFSTTSSIIDYINEHTKDIMSSVQDVPKISSFNLCAHRGSVTLQDNTLIAFESAIANGYRVIECDINWTSDNICILYHDATIGGVDVDTLTYAQIHSIDANIPKFDEMLLWAKKYKCLMMLDCVGRLNISQAVSLYNLTAQYGMLNNVIFAVGPDLALEMISENLTKTNVGLSYYGRNPTASMIENIDASVDQFDSVMTLFNKVDLTTEIITASHKRGYPVECAIIETEIEAQSYYNLGVDMLICNSDSLWHIS